MYKSEILKVNTEFDFKKLRGTTFKLISAESSKNKGLTYIVRVDKKKESVICNLNIEEWKEIQLCFKVDEWTKLKLLGDNSNYEDDKITLTYDIINQSGKSNGNNFYEIDDEGEDEDYDDGVYEENELLEDDDSNFEEESDINDIANDLWNECENEFNEQDKQYLGKKRKL